MIARSALSDGSDLHQWATPAACGKIGPVSTTATWRRIAHRSDRMLKRFATGLCVALFALASTAHAADDKKKEPAKAAEAKPAAKAASAAASAPAKKAEKKEKKGGC
jgi:hypothetical protein